MKFHLPTLAFALLLALSACGPQPKTSVKSAAPPTRTGLPPESIVSKPEIVTSKGTIAPGTPTIKVGLLLPLSGDSASVGAAMLDAATLALYDAYLATPAERIRAQIILMPKDSGSTPAEAARAAGQVIDQGAAFIVGPVFSQSLAAVAPLARERGISVLSFSNNKAAAAPGVFVFGVLPEQQVQRVADYAFLSRVQRVALLAPNDAYGQKIQSVLSDIYVKKGGVLSPAELFAPSPANIDAAVSRMATTYNNTPEERRFQAIFIADGGSQTKHILAALAKTNIDPKSIRLFGASAWDDPEIGKVPGLAGTIFATTPPDSLGDFERRFISGYGYKPMRLAGLAYDAVTLLAAASMSTDPARIDREMLLDPKGFVGPAMGLYRLRPDGTNERRLAILEVTESGFKPVDAALKFFEDQ